MLYIIRGLPGSGKSTLAQKLCGKRVYEADDFFTFKPGHYKFRPQYLKMAHEECLDNVKVAIRDNATCAVANTFTTIKEMRPYLDLECDTMVIECHGHFGSIHNVPQETIEKMKDRWEVYL